MPDSLRRVPLQLLFAIVIALPGAYLGAASYLGLPHPELTPPLAAAVYGLAIIGAAFVLSWAAEAAQVDISAGLALAVLALLAVLPEYAVDFVFGFRAGQVFEEYGSCVPDAAGTNPCSLALANMTGANRVLVGVGWPLVVLVATLAVRHAKRNGGQDSVSTHTGAVTMPRAMSAEVVFLGIATIYSLTLPLRWSLTLVDAAVLVAIFAAYAWRLAKAPAEEPDLQGASAWIAERPKRRRRWLVGGLFLLAAFVILTTAEHFAEGLVATGAELGVDPFVLVQWVAPLASESPELIVACLYAWRLKAGDSLGTLLSSKVNQWTLLVGTLPIVFAVSSTSLHGLPLDTHQRLELLLTASQSLFAVSLLVTLGLSLRGAVALLVLFLVQFATSIMLPAETDRIVVVAMSGVYLVLAVAQFVQHRALLVRTTKDGLATPFDELEKADEEAAARR
ncbi:sodium:proton exchanger [Pseudonocardia sp. T1-2H]|uniref:sodium:proton exchanger n=1 Tax=Pseudonocardia sp. T1-2H TaxID=3128899 RepID=UPI0031014F96